MAFERNSPVGLLVAVLALVSVAFLVHELLVGQSLLGVPSDLPFAVLMITAGVSFYLEHGFDRRAMTGAIVLLVLGGVIELVSLVTGPPILGGVGEVFVLVGIGLYLYETSFASR